MRGRIVKLLVVIATLSAVAVGSTAIAFAGGSGSAGQARTTHATRSQAHVAANTESAKRPRATPARSRTVRGDGEQAASEESSTHANDTDGTAQAIACAKAGIDPNADNVQYDEQSGSCSLESGSSANG